jgi:hypothetical protein
MAIKSWYDLERTPNTVMDIYRRVINDAQGFDEQFKELKEGTREYERIDTLRAAMYRVAMALENTEEINPSK